MKKLYSPIAILFILCMGIFSPLYSQWNFNYSINTPICVAADKQVDPRIIDDDHGGAFIAWKDYRTGIPDIYVQHIDSLGFVQWTVDGIGACTDFADQSTPSLTSDMAGGIIVTWSDWRSGIERDIYAQRIDVNGNILWATDGIAVTDQVQREHNERIVSDGAGGAIIAFEKQVGQWEIWAQRINNNGVPVWSPGGKKLTLVNSNMRNPKLQKDPVGGAYITWQDNRNGNYDIYAQHISATGVLEWGDNALQVCGATGDQTNPKIDPDSIGSGVYIGWTDDRNGNDNDIYCQLIDSAGTTLWPQDGIAVCTSVAGNQSALDMISNTKINGVIVAWKDSRMGSTDIYVQKLNRNGVAQWTPSGVLVAASNFPQINPNVCGDGNGGAIIAWQDSSNNSQWNIYTQRFDLNGNRLWGNSGVPVSNATASQTGPKNISDKNGGSIYVWEDYRAGGIRDIYAHHIGADGMSIGIEENHPVSNLTVYPNPFINDLNLHYTLSQTGYISIEIHNILGETVAEILPSTTLQEAGKHSIHYQASELASGIYFLEIRNQNKVQSIKVIKQ